MALHANILEPLTWRASSSVPQWLPENGHRGQVKIEQRAKFFQKQVICDEPYMHAGKESGVKRCTHKCLYADNLETHVSCEADIARGLLKR